MKLLESYKLAKSGRALTVVLTVALLVAVASVSPLKAQESGSPETDRQLLTGLYWVLGGPGWTDSDNWRKADVPFDQWEGVDTDAQGRVISLDLSGKGLTGAIPPGLTIRFDPSVFDIRLRELDLSDNDLSGQIPLGFAQLFPHLEVLRASNNQFSGPLPADFASLTNLTELDLDNNGFSGRIPAWMGDLTNLTILRLGSNDFDGPIPSQLGGLTNLSILGLGNNRLSGRIPSQIGNLKSLTRMSLFGNELEGPLPPTLGKLSKLVKLSVGSNKLSGDIPADLGNLTSLQELWLGSNQFTGCLLDTLKRLSNKSGSNLAGLPFCSDVPMSTPEDGAEAISAGFRHTCAVKQDGTVACWGDDDYGRATPPAGDFASVSVGEQHTCGVKVDGTVVCWGDDNFGQDMPPTGEFTFVSAGGIHTCGLRMDGSVVCWGSNYYGQATPLEGEFVSVSAGSAHTCGVRTDGTVACWGDNMDWEGNNVVGQATPPAGEFTFVSAGDLHTCGLRTDGTVACWGSNTDWEGNEAGQATPPDGAFASVSAGGMHSCGLRTDGSVACWGNNYHRQATPPDGAFVSVSAGGMHSCGLRMDGAVACWGNDTDGQASPPAGLFAVGAVEPAPTVPAEERAALVALYNDTGGPDSWTDKWDTDAPVAGWNRVTVLDGHVTGLNLTGNNLQGQLPAELGNLAKLERLHLYGNQLTGCVPDSLKSSLNMSRSNLDGLTFCSDAPTVPAEERAALLALYNNTGGLTNWDVKWNTDDYAYRLHGVTVEDGHVTELNLSGNNLQGEIPFALYRLSHLTHLDLSDNSLEGGIPFQLNNLTKLETLNLRDNGLTGAIPIPPPEGEGTTVGGLYNLKVLDLGGNKLTGKLSAELAALSGLEELRLDGNRFSGGLPAQWSGSLKVVALGFNDLRGEIPEGLAALSGLEELRLQGNRLSGDLPPQWSVSLKVINFSRYLTQREKSAWNPQITIPKLTGQIPAGLSNLTSLEVLDLSGNDLSGTMPDTLGIPGNLEVLDLRGNRLRGTIPDTLGSSNNLAVVDLSRNYLTGTIPESLGYLPKLVYLKLVDNRLTGCVPPALRNVDGVEIPLKQRGLNLEDICVTDGTKSDRYVLKHVYDLLGGADWIDPWPSPKNWVTNYKYDLNEFPGIKTDADEGRVIELDLSENNLSGNIPSVLANLDRLEVLDLSGNGLGGPIPAQFGDERNLPNLVSLNLTGNELIGCIPLAVKDALTTGVFESDFESVDNISGFRDKIPGWLNSAAIAVATTAVTELKGETTGKATGKFFSRAITVRGLADRILKYKVGDLGMPLCAPSPDPRGRLTPSEEQTIETDLEALDAIESHFGITDVGFQTRKIDGEPRITRLGVDGKNLTGTIPRQLGDLGQLRYLNLSKNQLSGPIPPELGNLPYLRTLALNDNQLSGEIPAELAHLHRLERLELKNNNLEGWIPSEMALNASSSLRVMHVDRYDPNKPSEGGVQGCLPPNHRFLKSELVTTVTDTVAITVLTSGAGIGGSLVVKVPAAVAARIGNLTVTRGSMIYRILTSPGFRATVKSAYDLVQTYPKSAKFAGAISNAVYTAVAEQTLQSLEGPAGEGFTLLFSPSEQLGELMGRIGEFFNWHGLGGELDMDSVYCDRSG